MPQSSFNGKIRFEKSSLSPETIAVRVPPKTGNFEFENESSTPHRNIHSPNSKNRISLLNFFYFSLHHIRYRQRRSLLKDCIHNNFFSCMLFNMEIRSELFSHVSCKTIAEIMRLHEPAEQRGEAREVSAHTQIHCHHSIFQKRITAVEGGGSCASKHSVEAEQITISGWPPPYATGRGVPSRQLFSWLSKTCQSVKRAFIPRKKKLIKKTLNGKGQAFLTLC